MRSRAKEKAVGASRDARRSTGAAIEQLEGRTFFSGTISGTQFHDYNSDGVRQAGEPALFGWGCFLDANANGIYDNGSDFRVLSDTNGAYTFANLAPGTYYISQMTPQGWARTLPKSPRTYIVNLADNQNLTGRNFGNVAVGNLTWASLPTVPLGRSEAMGASVGGKFYLFGGYTNTTVIVPSNQVHRYDPATNQWESRANMPQGLTHSGLAVDGRYIYLAGGYPPNASGTFQQYTTTAVRRYDTINNSWISIRSLPQGRGAGNMVLLGRSLHFFSGADVNRQDRNEHWSLDLSVPSAYWVTRAPIPTARNHLGAAVLNGKIYAIGGAKMQDENETALATVEIYDPTTNKWTTGPSMPTPRALIMSGVVVRAGRIIVAGGETRFNGATSQVTSFDPGTNQWKQLRALPAPRISGILGLLGNELIFATGYYYNAPPNGFSNTAWRGVFA